MDIIKENKETIAIVFYEKDWKKGLNFLTDDKEFIQVATWWYNKDRISPSHKHKRNKRIVERTQESVFVKKGSIEIKLYNEANKKIKTIILKSGDMIIILGGGHRYKILENSTQAIEFKNGPFLGVEIDKTLI